MSLIVDSKCETRILSYLPAVIGHFQVVICLLARWHSFSTSTSKQTPVFLRNQTMHFSWWYAGRKCSYTKEYYQSENTFKEAYSDICMKIYITSKLAIYSKVS